MGSRTTLRAMASRPGFRLEGSSLYPSVSSLRRASGSVIPVIEAMSRSPSVVFP